MGNAGLISGNFTGTHASTGNADDSLIGGNSPESKLNGSGWGVLYADYSGGGTSNSYVINHGNHFVIGSDCGNNCLLNGAQFSPSEVWNFDKKIDDGRPAYGKVIARRWDECTDATANTDFDSDYLLTVSDKACTLVFIKQF